MSDKLVTVTLPKDEALQTYFASHPGVSMQVENSIENRIEFSIGARKRVISFSKQSGAIGGLPELMDNNPLVCADLANAPGPLATLGLIALGPLVRAGLLLESPSILTNLEESPTELDRYLADEGWEHGVDVSQVESSFHSVCTAVCMALITMPERESEIDDLFDETYGRSCFVRRNEESEWDIALADRTPNGVYRLRITPDGSQALLTIQVLADLSGKCGAAQIVHLFNIMCGFEETLGILPNLPEMENERL